MAYCMAIVLMFLKVFLMVGIGILNLSSSSFIDGMCVVALAPAVMTIRGSIFHPLATILSISGLYLLVLASSVSGENLSLQYVNSINCMVRLGSISVGGSLWYGKPLTHRMSGLNLELQWHLCVPHVQGSSQLGAVFSWGLSLKVPAFMRVKHRDFSDETSNFLISQTALLCLLTWSECICCCWHVSSTWNHVSGSYELQMGHVIDGNLCLPKNICFLAWPM